ncbi:MAG: polysaccharide biosynthesis/export family protein [Pyrinomonadaceae bacterium]
MKLTYSAIAILIALIVSVAGFGQTRSNNNPYSPSPQKESAEVTPSKNTIEHGGPVKAAFTLNASTVEKPRTKPVFAPTIIEIPRTDVSPAEKPLTEIYRVGVGDVLFINLKNSPQGSGIYKVSSDGSIDYPLAGGSISVINNTPGSIAETLASAIKLYANPTVEVRVDQYLSHAVVVNGLAESTGQRNLRREAMPLFALRAECVVGAGATKAIIIRGSGAESETYDLKDPASDNILIRPGDTVDFSSDRTELSPGFFYLAGQVVSGGRRDLTAGLTMSKAILNAGGARAKAFKVVIRRLNDTKAITRSEYDLRSINAGKIADPLLQNGDVVEVIK